MHANVGLMVSVFAAAAQTPDKLSDSLKMILTNILDESRGGWIRLTVVPKVVTSEMFKDGLRSERETTFHATVIRAIRELWESLALNNGASVLR